MSSLIGQTLGQYRVLEEIGAGGMGVVFRAEDVELGRRVALKVLPPGTAPDEEAVERFRREARTASSLNHANICTIYSFDEHAGRLFLAMELLAGEPLDRKLASGPIALSVLLDIGLQIGDALQAAHQQGILHRDIKPANIFVTRDGQVKVLDFGLAKLTAPAELARGAHPTHRFSSLAGTTVGTVSYMSPEQARGEDLDPRTDLFSFGVVLYEMATGHQSFPGATTAVVFDGILNREPMPPSLLNAALPPELDRIVAKALEKDRQLRYQTAADMRADLQRLRRDHGSPSAASRARADSHETTVPLPPIEPSASASGAGSAAAAGVTPVAPAARSGDASATIPARWSSMSVVAAVLFLTGLAVMTLIALSLPTVTDLDSSRPDNGADPGQRGAAPAADPGVATPPDPEASAPVPQPVSSQRAENRAPTAAEKTPGPGALAVEAKPAAAVAGNAAPTKLEIAREMMANKLYQPALNELRQVMVESPGSTAAADASLLTAEALEKLGRINEAMAAHVEFSKRFPSDRRVAASKLRLAEFALSSDRPDRESDALRILSEIAVLYPRTPQALQALQIKLRLESGRRQRAIDPVTGVQAPLVLPTLRALTEQFPTAPISMGAFLRLADTYRDLELFERAAQAYADLATNFPANPHDAWFQAGEIYERRLKDADRARSAFEKVPPGTNRYRDAQRKLKR